MTQTRSAKDAPLENSTRRCTLIFSLSMVCIFEKLKWKEMNCVRGLCLPRCFACTCFWMPKTQKSCLSICNRFSHFLQVYLSMLDCRLDGQRTNRAAGPRSTRDCFTWGQYRHTSSFSVVTSSYLPLSFYLWLWKQSNSAEAFPATSSDITNTQQLDSGLTFFVLVQRWAAREET